VPDTHEILLGEVREFVGAELGEDVHPDDSVVVSGSLTSGFGNETSDVDVYLLRGSAAPRFDAHQLFGLGRRIDLHDLTRRDFDDLVHRASDYGDGRSASISSADVTTLYRVVEGIWIIGRPLDAEARTSAKAALRAAVERLARRRLGHSWQQFAVAAALHDPDAIEPAATALLEDILFALLAEQDALYPNVKWNWEKLARLEKPEVIRNCVTQVEAILRSASNVPAEETLGAVNEALTSSSPGVRVPTFTWNPTRPPDVSIMQRSEGWVIWDGVNVWEASDAITFVLDRCDGRRDVQSIVDAVAGAFGGAESRLAEDTWVALDQLLAHGLVASGNAEQQEKLRAFDVRPSEPIFDVALSPPARAAEYIGHRARLWREWLEYLAFRDDFTGARAAAQAGAVLAAARGMIRQAVRLALLTDAVEEARAEDELRLFRAVVGGEHEQYRRVLDVFRRSPLAVDDLEAFAEAVEQLAGDLVGRPEIVLGGGLRDELEHAELFAILEELARLAEEFGVTVPVEPELVEKARSLA
jgi:signal recognition particle subunit SEC65